MHRRFNRAGRRLALLLLWSAPVLADVEQAEVVGRAEELDSGRFLYSEHYRCGEDDLHCEVEYRDPQGDVIARKSLDYSDSLYAPEVVMRDLRRDETTVVDMTPREDLVVDAGFDNFVRSRWDRLAAGETVRFSFRVVNIDRMLSMKARARDDADCKDETLCIDVEVDSFFLGLLTDPIELTYARDSRRLLRFSGVSNLKAPDGGRQTVDIRYEYADSGKSELAEGDTASLVRAEIKTNSVLPSRAPQEYGCAGTRQKTYILVQGRPLFGVFQRDPALLAPGVASPQSEILFVPGRPASPRRACAPSARDYWRLTRRRAGSANQSETVRLERHRLHRLPVYR
ncbi:MAG: hypothetical protein U5K56_17200 [Halioglobus sp.]|nr:hypothetical protein [Halioglobus sp.]